MIVQVLLFATLKDKVGAGKFSLDLALLTATVADVRTNLATRYPAAAANLGAAIAAVNEEYAFDADMVHDGDRVAFFPPVSGGSGEPFPTICQLAAEPLDLDDLTSSVTTPETGAVCIFSGMVRGRTSADGSVSQTAFLDYEAYEPMAFAKMEQVAKEIRQQWPLVQGIAVVQRVGRLEVGQNTIVIACSSGHRDQGCFEAARYGIDRLKEIVPVWKKDVRPDGTDWVEGHYMPVPDDRQNKT